jgi:hypothetical protein
VSSRTATAWLFTCLLLAYGLDVGHGFIADDFGWIYFSRIRSLADAWTLLVDGTPGFYRPLVGLSFGLNEMVFGLSPAAFAATNLALAAGIIAGIVGLARALGWPAVAGVFGAALWALNFHGISMALVWVSGRTSLLTTICAVWAGVAHLRGHGLWAGWLTLGALLSKEEPVLLPVVFAAWTWLDTRVTGERSAARTIRTVVRATWPSFAALAVYFAMRARTDAFTPATAPSFYKLSASPGVLIPNTLQYLDRSLTFTAAVLLLGFLIFSRRRVRLAPLERQTLARGVAWLVLGFGVTIMIPVRSSLYVVFPTIGSALMGMAAGAAVWRSIPASRLRAALIALVILPIVLLPIHWARHRTTRQQAVLSSRVLARIGSAVSLAPDASRIVVVDDPQARPSVASAFGAELARAVELATGRALAAAIITRDPSGLLPASVYEPGTLAFVLDNGDIIPLGR